MKKSDDFGSCFRRLQFRNTETHFDVQNTCPKILKCFCFPKIWVIHLDKLYYIFYCLHFNNTCWLFFHIVDHYKVTDMFELFQQFSFHFLIDFRKGIFQLQCYYYKEYQRLYHQLSYIRSIYVEIFAISKYERIQIDMKAQNIHLIHKVCGNINEIGFL